MQAILYDQFQVAPTLQQVPDPEPPEHGVVIEVKASGVCRSDWHGWMGHDPEITLPHVPGHEMAGVVVAVGAEVKNWRPGDRVTVPFVCGCGDCEFCQDGNSQVCSYQTQPGFTHWGSFAEYTVIHQADYNLVSMPSTLDFTATAALGCRFSTAYWALIVQGRLHPGQWLAVYGCGGVGLSAIMIAKALGCRTIAIDIQEASLELARELGADHTINSSLTEASETVLEYSSGGVHVSLDAIGNQEVIECSISSLRQKGKHVQVGLLAPGKQFVSLPFPLITARELEIIGSHGIPAGHYPDLYKLIMNSGLNPGALVSKEISLRDSIDPLTQMGNDQYPGILVITDFSG